MSQHLTLAADNSERIRVLAADSTRMSSQLLVDALAQEHRFEVAGMEPKPSSILEAIGRQKPHVVLVSSTLDGSPSFGFEVAGMEPKPSSILEAIGRQKPHVV